jgi:hypothetical protein
MPCELLIAKSSVAHVTKLGLGNEEIQTKLGLGNEESTGNFPARPGFHPHPLRGNPAQGLRAKALFSI